MSKRFSVNSEFFGGIIKDNLNKENYSIDKLFFDLLMILSNNLSIEKFLEIHNNIEIKDILEMILELLEVEIININADVKNTETDESKLVFPLRIFYDITYACNLRCKHCFSKSGNKNSQELTLDEKIILVKQMKELGVGRVSIAGGEPLCCNDFFPFVNECRRNGIEVSVSTNGLCFDEEIVRELNECELKTITVSVDGDESNNDAIRGKGSFEKAVNGLKVLKKFYKYNYCIKMTLMKTNINDIEKVIKLGIDCGCNSVKFNCVREDGRALDNKNLVILQREEYLYVLEHIEKLKEKYKDIIKIKAPLSVYCAEEYSYIKELGFGCFAGKESICVDALGNVRACSHFPEEFIAGNIRDNTLKEIWNNSDKLSVFRNLGGNKECNECKNYDKCRGGCRYRAFLKGDINGKDPFCFLENES